MDFLRGQYVIYGPARIILIEDEVQGQYNPATCYSVFSQECERHDFAPFYGFAFGF